MLVLGIVLLVVAIVVIGYIGLATVDSAAQSIDLWVVSVHLSPFHLFLLGIGTAIVLQLGVWFTVWGLRRNRRRAVEMRELRARDPEAGTPTQGRSGKQGTQTPEAPTGTPAGAGTRSGGVASPGIDAAYRRSRTQDSGTAATQTGSTGSAPTEPTKPTQPTQPTRGAAPTRPAKPQYDRSDVTHEPPVPPRGSPDEGENTSGFTRDER